MHYVQQERRPNAFNNVRSISGNTFLSDFMADPTLTQCVIELKKEMCSACYTNGCIFDLVAAKMHKHGFL